MAEGDPPAPRNDIFCDLPVRMIRTGSGVQLAVHVSGRLDDRRPPLICLADYCRNMVDFSDLLTKLPVLGGADWPVVLIDLAGHGRSGHRKKASLYSTPSDAEDVHAVACALGVEKAVFLGQGHGGQVIMALAGHHAELMAGAVLIDAAPVLHAPGLVRLRDNVEMMTRIRDLRQFRAISRQVFCVSNPGATNDELDRLTERTFHWKGGQRRGRAVPRFDMALIRKLAHVQVDDIFQAQWPLFHMLDGVPMMLMRTQFSDQLPRSTFERMAELRMDAVQVSIAGQGSPALLHDADEIAALVTFMNHAAHHCPDFSVVSG